MAIRKLNMTNDWTWHILKDLSQVKQHDIRYEHLDFFRCMGDYHLYRVKSPRLHREEQGNNALYGSFLYGNRPDKKSDELRLIYYVSEKHLFTVQLQLSRIGMNEDELLGRLQPCSKGYEGLIGILCEIAQSCHTGLDKYEEELRASELNRLHSDHSVHSEKLHGQIMACQYELVLWRHRIVPMEELLLALGEAFPALMDNEQGEFLHVLNSRVRRLTLRLKRYEEELAVLLTINQDRTDGGNGKLINPSALFAIGAAQTALLAVSASICIFGVLGRELNWVYGAAILAILVMSAFMCIFLIRKGWTSVAQPKRKKRKFNPT